MGRKNRVGVGSGVDVGKGVGGIAVGLAGGIGVVVGAMVGVGDKTKANTGTETVGLLTSGK